jgi:hypothetical protein
VSAEGPTPRDGSGRRAGRRPVLRVVAGDATPEEIAAVVAAVAAAAAPAQDHGGPLPARTASTWSAPGYAHRNIRATFTPGPDSWRTSFWPH